MISREKKKQNELSSSPSFLSVDYVPLLFQSYGVCFCSYFPSLSRSFSLFLSLSLKRYQGNVFLFVHAVTVSCDTSALHRMHVRCLQALQEWFSCSLTTVASFSLKKDEWLISAYCLLTAFTWLLYFLCGTSRHLASIAARSLLFRAKLFNNHFRLAFCSPISSFQSFRPLSRGSALCNSCGYPLSQNKRRFHLGPLPFRYPRQ